MTEEIGRVYRDLAARQHGVAGVWQLRMWFTRAQVDWWLRKTEPPRVRRGVYGEPAPPFGAHMAAVLALGPEAAISHVSGVELWGMRDPEEAPIHVSVPGRGGREQRDGMVIHRPLRVVKAHRHGIPVMTPTRCLRDARLPRHELYRALEEAERRRFELTLPLDAVVRTQQAVRGYTRSPAEAEALLVFQEHGITLPLVNHRLNGIEADFHWPSTRTVLEIDGWEWHNERPQFEEDRRRELVHAAAGWQVIRASATQVFSTPELLVRAVAPPVL